MTEVLVVGAGSIGARHARNLTDLGATVTLTDPDSDRAVSVAASIAGRSVPFDVDGFGDHDGVVVASPTAFHASHAQAALRGSAKVLVEKPLALRAAEVDDIGDELDRVMVGFNLRLHRPLVDLMALVADGALGDIISARLWFGSWLPDWRPDVDYRTTYSANLHLGGGVLLDAIHEVDILLWLARDDDRFDVLSVFVDRLGPLEIDVEDTVRALLRHSDGWIAEIALDYLSRRYRRGVEVIGSRATARLDWARETLELETADGVQAWPADAAVSLSYVAEAERFLAFVRSGAAPPVDGTRGVRSLELAERIRAEAR